MDTYRVIETGAPSSSASVALSAGNTSESYSTAESSPIPTAESSRNTNAGVTLAPRDILHCALLYGGIVTTLTML
jgi:hypothetical protein